MKHDAMTAVRLDDTFEEGMQAGAALSQMQDARS